MRKGFTLIEMLIVAAILAILAAIATPNFMAAQSRAKISQVKNDLRTIDVALNSYMLDHKNYPFPKCAMIDGFAAGWIYFTYELSTPIAYLQNTQMPDPFGAPNVWKQYGSPLFSKLSTLPYAYTCFSGFFGQQYLAKDQRCPGFLIYSSGPNLRLDWPEFGFFSGIYGNFKLVPYGSSTSFGGPNALYDPTNGSMSSGDITRFGGDLPEHPAND